MISQYSAPFRMDLPEKRICIWGAPSQIAAPEADIWTKLSESGANLGNLFIGAGLIEATKAATVEYHPGFLTMTPEETSERYDAIFMAASNFIGRSADLTQAYNYLSQTTLPIICFGLGSQFLPGEDIVLTPGTQRMLKLVSDRSGSVGVRGTFTAELLWKIGIRNLSLIGCPSLMLFNGRAAASLADRKPSLLRVAANYSNNVRIHALSPEALTATENSLFRRLLHEDSYYVLQNEDAEMEILSPRDEGEWRAMVVRATVMEIFNLRDVEDAAQKYLSHRMMMFFDVRQWISAMSKMSLAIGSRFHGNVAAVLGGTPALFLAHDMRTIELCETFRMPHVRVDRTYSGAELVEIASSIKYGPFIENMRKMHTEWRLFMSRNGLLEKGL